MIIRAQPTKPQQTGQQSTQQATNKQLNKAPTKQPTNLERAEKPVNAGETEPNQQAPNKQEEGDVVEESTNRSTINPTNNQQATQHLTRSKEIEKKEKEKKEERNKYRGIPPTPLTRLDVVTELTEEDAASLGVEPALCEPVSNWINNRTARGEPLTEGELKSMVSMVKANTVKYGAQAVSDLITENMGNGYKGILWDRLERKSRDKPRKSVAEQFMEIPL